MTTENNNVPAGATNTNEDQKSISERSVTTAYLLYSRDNSEGIYNTFGGDKLPITDYVRVLVPASFIYALDPKRMMLSPDDVSAFTRAWRRNAEEKLAKERQALERQIRADLEDEYREQLEELDKEADKVYAPLYAEMDARFNAALLEQGVNPDDPY